MEIISQSFELQSGNSKSMPAFGCVVSARSLSSNTAELVVGAPGLPNTVREFLLGDALLFDTPAAGLIEIRLTTFMYPRIEVLATKVSPRLGITAGLQADGGQNTPFSRDEREQIRVDLLSVTARMSERSDLAPEQLELLTRKLDEVVAASERLGRKDWIMYAVGNLTNVILSAALPPEAAKALFVSMNDALGWVFENALRLLGT